MAPAIALAPKMRAEVAVPAIWLAPKTLGEVVVPAIPSATQVIGEVVPAIALAPGIRQQEVGNWQQPARSTQKQRQQQQQAVSKDSKNA